MSWYSSPRAGGYGHSGGRGPYGGGPYGGGSYGLSYGGGSYGWGRPRRRRRYRYGPRMSFSGLSGRGAALRRRRDRRLRLWMTASERAREETADDDRLREEESMRISEEDARRSKTLTVNALDLHLDENLEAHRADQYYLNPKQLVLRRGQEFTLTVTFDRSYNKQLDDLEFVFSPDDEEKALDVSFPLDEERHGGFPPDHQSWGARIVGSTGSRLQLRVHVAGDALVAEWDLQIRTKMREGEDSDEYVYDYPQSIFILFNPWSPGDQVYFTEDPDLLEEYVLETSGQVYRGNFNRYFPSGWTYGQFDKDILHICMSLLRRAFQDDMSAAMKHPVPVSRALSRIVNSQDDRGVLVGNWSGSYEGGTAPTYWTSSVPILRKFNRTGPVKFGQCWVYSHVLTTVCRALGLPCRSVTNFESAHDTNSNCTIDFYFDDDGKKDTWKTKDSIWNFHVWNEVWMLRPDLGARYDGWHVIDATPQEISDNMMQCGPCPVRAVKEGEVKVGEKEAKGDTKFVFSEVNAELVHWTQQPGSDRYSVSEVDSKRVGKKLLTKYPKATQEMDITHNYKYPEGSKEERESVYRALGTERPPRGDLNKDLEVSFEPDPGTDVGREIVMKVRIRNASSRDRVVGVTLKARATHYWDVLHADRVLASQAGQTTVPAGRVVLLSLPVPFQEYLGVCDDTWTIQGLAKVEDLLTNRPYTAEQRFSLRTPPLLVTGPKGAKSGQPVTVTIQLINPLPIPLHNCSVHMDGTLQVAPDDPHAWSNEDGSSSMDFRRGGVVRPSERVTMTVRLVGEWRSRFERNTTKSMVITFHCNQLPGIQGTYVLAWQP